MAKDSKRKSEDKRGLEVASIDCSSLFNVKGLIAKPGDTIDLTILQGIFSKKEVFIPKPCFSVKR
jgi:hypothetical protein